MPRTAMRDARFAMRAFSRRVPAHLASRIPYQPPTAEFHFPSMKTLKNRGNSCTINPREPEIKLAWIDGFDAHFQVAVLHCNPGVKEA
jgi:hypothetical protein